MIDPALLQDFITETREHLEEMETSLLNLESDPGNTDILNDIFRSAHTIKGAAGFVGIAGIGELSHKLEDLLEILRYGKYQTTREMIDALIEAKDRMETLVQDLETDGGENTGIDDLTAEILRLTKACDEDAVTGEDAPPLAEAGFEEPEPDLKDEVGFEEEDTEVPDDYDEEHDKELFEIFFQHLKENIDKVLANVDEMSASGDKAADLLLATLELVNSLHSSANYMGYANLAGYYEKWRAEIAGGLEMLAESEDEFNVGGFSFLMRSYVDEIYRRFPKLEEGEEETVSDEPVADEEIPETDEAVTDIDFDDFGIPGEQNEEDEEEVDVTNLGFFDAIRDETFPDGDETEDTFDEPTFDKQGLYDELDDVFDDHQGLYDELDDVFDDLTQVAMDFDADAPDAGVETVKKPKTARPKPAKPTPKAPARIGEASAFDAFLDKAASFEKSETLKKFEPLKKEPAPAIPATKSEVKRKAPTPPAKPEKAKKREPGEKTIKSSLRVDASKIDSLMNQVGELVVSRAWFSQLHTEMRGLQSQLRGRLDQREMKPVKALAFRISEATTALGRVANDLQEGVMKVRMLPIAQLFNRYPRLVRDLTHDIDKSVKLEIVGEDTELDKMVIEEIGDPMIHIIRNAVDHGCEEVSERLAVGKPEECTLKLESYHESNHVVIEVSDDGRGIDTERIKEKALEKNLFSQDELDRMTHRELMSIIMKPGFSTAAEISETSGRGVGMDVVKENIEKLNGTIEIDSQVGEGTRFRIKIPLTLAIIQALLVRVGKEIFTIPLAAVEETLRIFENEITWMEGLEVIHLRDYTLPLLRLSSIFNIESESANSKKFFVVVVNSGMRNVGLVVDVLIGQEEVVIKPLVDYLQESSGFSGATILGDGRISLILDIYELINLSIGMQIRRNKQPMAMKMPDKTYMGMSDMYKPNSAFDV